MRRIMGALAVALALTACGGETEPGEGSESATEYVESEACREDAAEVVEILSLTTAPDATQETMAEKHAALLELGSAPTARCTEAVAEPIRRAVESLGCSYRDGLLASAGACRDVEKFEVGRYVTEAYRALESTK